MVSICLLGRLQIQHDAQSVSPLRAKTDGWLLGLLAISSPKPQDREWLATVLWPDSTQEQGLYNVRRALSSLRRALGGEAAECLQNIPPHHLAMVSMPTVISCDVWEFDRAVQNGDWERAITLYGGKLLEGCDLAEVAPERDRRHEMFLLACEHHASGAVTASERILRWQGVLAHDHLRESAVRGLMQCYQETNETARALQVYRTLRMSMAEGMLGEPSAATHTLYLQIRQGEAATVPALSSEATESSTLHHFPHHLMQGPLLGREAECSEIARRLQPTANSGNSTRIVTLSGQGGMGKTRLALEIATQVRHEFSALYFLSLAESNESTTLANALRQTLTPGKPVADALGEVITTLQPFQRVLLLLDNLESLLLAPGMRNEVIATLKRLLDEAPRVCCLITSRQPTHVAGEQVFPLTPLGLPSSIALFQERQNPTQESDSASIATICEYMEGVPLAIELVAAHTRLLSSKALLTLLEKSGRWQVTRRPVREGVRHQSLWHVIQTSVEQQDESSRHLFTRLAVFRGGWTLESAHSIGGLDDLGATLIALEQLADASLILNLGNSRMTMLESVREYAVHAMPETDCQAATLTHAHYFAEWAKAQGRDFAARQVEVMQSLDGESDNLYCAIQTLLQSPNPEDHSTLAEMISPICLYFALRQPGKKILTDTIALLDKLDKETITAVRLTEVLGSIHAMQGEYEQARAAFTTALTHHRQTQEGPRLAQMLGNLGGLAIEHEQGDYALAQTYLQEAQFYARQMDTPRFLGIVLGNLGVALLRQDNLDAAEQYLQESLAIRTTLKDTRGIAVANDNLGAIALKRGQYVTAEEAYKNASELYQSLGDAFGEAGAQDGLGSAYVGQEKYGEGQERFDKATQLRASSGRAIPPSDEAEITPYKEKLRLAVQNGSIKDPTIVRHRPETKNTS
jgi:predicted ATPase/DNA-binding SARP family transcriptional activator/Tfp pilus assembly protein PilF